MDLIFISFILDLLNFHTSLFLHKWQNHFKAFLIHRKWLAVTAVCIMLFLKCKQKKAIHKSSRTQIAVMQLNNLKENLYMIGFFPAFEFIFGKNMVNIHWISYSLFMSVCRLPWILSIYKKKKTGIGFIFSEHMKWTLSFCFLISDRRKIMFMFWVFHFNCNSLGCVLSESSPAGCFPFTFQEWLSKLKWCVEL